MADYQWGSNRTATGFVWNANRNAGNPPPTIDSVTGTQVTGGSLVVAGTNFQATQDTGKFQLAQGANLANMPVTAWADTSATVDIPSIEATSLKYGAASLEVVNSFSDTATTSVSISPASPRSSQDVASFDANKAGTISFLVGGSNRLPKAGDQLAYDPQLYIKNGAAVTGFTVAITDTLTYKIIGNGVQPNGNYEIRDVRGYDIDSGVWGNSATMPIIIATALEPIFSGTVPDITTEVGEYFTLDLSEYFQNNPTNYVRISINELPAGFAINPSSGVISGTGQAIETQTNLVFTGSNGSGQASTGQFSWNVVAPSVVKPGLIGNITNKANIVGDSVSISITSLFSNGPTGYVSTGLPLPTGLSVVSGVIQGILTEAGSFTGLEITGSNAAGDAVSNTFSWDVAPIGVNAAPTVTPPTDQTLTFAYGTAGLAKNDAALIAAIATASAVDDTDTVSVQADLSALADPILEGTYTIPFTATDSEPLTGTANWVLTVAEEAAPIIRPSFLINLVDLQGNVGVVENRSIASSWGNNPTNFQVTSGLLPSGISLTAAGTFVGTYQQEEALSGIIVTATNSAGSRVSNAFSWSVIATGAATFSGTLKDGISNVAFSNKVGNKITISSELGGAKIHTNDLTFDTDSLGAYSIDVPEAKVGDTYYVQKESADGTITSLQKQVAT